MPELFRKIFPATDRSGAGSDAAGAAVAADPAEGLQAVPVGLARLREGEVLALNGLGRALLREVVGGSDHANERWLAAAVTRQLVAGREKEILSGRSDTLSVEVRLGPACPDTGERLVAVRPVGETGGARADLVETVSTLSHELRTPLASMKSSLRLVLGGDAGDVTADQQRFLDLTLRNVDRLERLVNDLLDVSRSGGEAPALQTREIDLGPVLREAVALHGPAARNAGLELDATGLPERLRAHADPDRITRIVANVVGNSLKYTPAGGLVRVWVQPHPRPDDGLAWRLAEDLFLPLHTWNLVVEDSGVGMTPAEVERVFEPWYRGRRHAGPARDGSGLGLHITRGLVEAHGGSIRLASTPGRGTTVWIRLPRDPASEQLLRAVRELRALARRGAATAVALLDGRPERPVVDLVEDFIAGGVDAAATKAVVPAPSLAACPVADPAAFAAAWRRHCAERPSTAALPGWRFLPLGPDAATRSQFPGIPADTMDRKRPVTGQGPGSLEA